MNQDNITLLSVNMNDFQFVCNCAVRYALGRRTYAVSIVVEFVQSHMDQMDILAVNSMIRNIEAQADYGEKAYGDDCDKKLWMELLLGLQKRLAQLNQKAESMR